jgi:hypothetical protein
MFVLLIAISADKSSEETAAGTGRGGRRNGEAGCAHFGATMKKVTSNLRDAGWINL